MVSNRGLRPKGHSGSGLYILIFETYSLGAAIQIIVRVLQTDPQVMPKLESIPAGKCRNK